MPYVFTSGIGVIRNTKKEGYHGKYYQNGISQTPQVFIDCQVFDQDDELLINWDVREGIFLPEVIDEMFLMFQDLICNFLIDAENWNVEKVTAILNKNIKITAFMIRIRKSVQNIIRRLRKSAVGNGQKCNCVMIRLMLLP